MSKDFVSYALLTAGAKVLQFLMLPLLTRLFTPAEYGVVDLLATFAALITILVSLSLESAVARFWHEAEGRLQRQHVLSSTATFVATFGGIVFLIVCGTAGLLSQQMLGKPDLGPEIVMAVGAAVLLAIAAIPQMALRMDRQILRFGTLQVLNIGLGIVLALFFMLKAGMGLRGLFLGYLVAAAATLALSAFWTREYFCGALSLTALRSGLAYGLPLTPAVLINWASAQADRIVLLALLGLGVVGVYGAAAKIAAIITVMVEVFRLAWLPLAMRQIGSPQQAVYFRRSLAGYLAATTAVGLVLAAFSQELLVLLATGEYAAGYGMIPWLVGAQIYYGSSNITNIGMLISKRTGGNSLAASVAAAVNVTACLLLVSWFGAAGAAIGSCIAALLFTVMLLWFSIRSVRIPFDLAHAACLCLLYAGTSVGILWLYRSAADSSLQRAILLVAALALVAAVSARTLRRPQPLGVALPTFPASEGR